VHFEVASKRRRHRHRFQFCSRSLQKKTHPLSICLRHA
jgi:hypothetical protein